MTPGISDPTGDDVIQEGRRLTTPVAGNRSHMPPSAVDGELDEERDVKVPLAGGEAPEPLDVSATEALAKAADESRQNNSQNPDQSGADANLANPGQDADRTEDGSEWMGDA
jgi:hypothetical protein